MIIGTAGHIDHGKTLLVHALTGVDADRLKEEKLRGITIDLGYAYQSLANNEVLGFVDMPGHERFIHNMLAGATGIDFVLLTVAADDGIMPQTREHLDIVHLLGVTRGAVALTKIDRVSAERGAAVESEVRALLAATALAAAPAFRVSAVTGEGVAALRAHLHAEAAKGATRELDHGFRLAVDRTFTLAGSGTVVTGTVHAGRVRIGDKLLVSPRGLEVRVRGIHAQHRPAEEGRAGERCALNLAGAGKADIVRGDWLVDAAVHAPSERIDVRLRLLADAPRALKHWMPLHLHLGAADVPARLSLLAGESLTPGGSAYAQLVLDRPIGVLRGDCFIVRDPAARRTLGGGTVIDPFAPARHVRTSARLAQLAALDSAKPEEALRALLQVTPQGVSLDRFRQSWNLTAATAGALFENAALHQARTASGAFGFPLDRWVAYGERLIESLAQAHRDQPEQMGVEARALRRAALPALAWEVYVLLLEDAMGAGRIGRHGPWLHLPGHRVRLTPQDEALWHRVAPLLRATPFQPPWVRDIARTLKADEAVVRTLLKRVALLGDAYEVVRDRFFSAEAMGELTRIATALTADGRAIAAAEFRDQIGTGRKLAIQILEYFDRTGFSRRVGDTHRMRDTSLLAGERRTVPTISGRASHPGGAT